MEKLFRKHYLEMQEFRAFAKNHLMYIDEYHNMVRSHDNMESVQSWQNYQAGGFKRQRLLQKEQE